MKKKIIAVIDLDGTLLKDDKSLSNENIEAVKELISKGAVVILATARPPRSSVKYHNMLGLDSPIISYNGAYVVNPKKNQVVHHAPIPSQQLKDIVLFSQKKLADVIVHLEVMDKWITNRFDPDKLLATAKEGFRPDFIGDISGFLENPSTKLLFLDESENITSLKSHLIKRFHNQVYIVQNEDFCIQITSLQSTKDIALLKTLDYLGIKSYFMAAFGDGENDKEILSLADLSLAMENGDKSLLSSADKILPSNNNSGVAYGIHKYILPLLK